MKRTPSCCGDEKGLRQQALEADEAAARLARGRPAVDVALGELFLRLSMGDRLSKLSFSKQADFATEELGMPRRDYSALFKLAVDLRKRPLLREAVVAGQVSIVKAQLVMGRAIGDEESSWVAAAMEMKIRELKPLLGGDEIDRVASFRTLRFRMTPEQQDRLDAALSLAKKMVGYDARRGKLMEAVAREWLSSWKHTGEPEPEEKPSGIDPDWLKEMKRNKDEVSKQLRAYFEAAEVLARDIDDDGDNELALLARAKLLYERREKFDEPLGRVLAEIRRDQLWKWLGYENFAEYCRERLGIAESTANERIRLEERMKELPALREALISGRITYTKAVLVARRATPLDIKERIADAATTTCQQTQRRVETEEDQADRKASRRKVRGTAEEARVVLRAVDSARRFFRERGEEIDDGGALGRIGDHFFDRYELPIRRSQWRRKWEQDVMLRHGGLCAVPGCTREAVHLHHIVAREDRGPDKPFNAIGLCKVHHYRGPHGKSIRVRGRGGERLVWVFLDSEGRERERWITTGADDVRSHQGNSSETRSLPSQ